MNEKRQLVSIGEAYGQVLNKLIFEKTASPKDIPSDTFELNKAKNTKLKLKKKAFVGKKSGPDGVDGVKPLPPQLKENEKFSVKSEKTQTPQINTFMNKKFDDLYNDVVKGRVRLNEDDGSLEADVEATAEMPEGDGELPGEDGGAPVGDEPHTPAEHLQVALDHIQLALDELNGGAEGEEGLGDDLPGVDDADGAPGSDEVAGEATEMKEVKDSEGQKLQAKSNKVAGTVTSHAGKGKHGDGSISGGGNGELKPVKDSAHSALQGKNNKVNTSAKPGHQIGQ